MSRRPRRSLARRVQRAALASGAAGLMAAGSTVALVAGGQARRRALMERSDPLGPKGSTLPEGRSLVVTTDDGAHLAVTVAGPDDGPTVVLSHCWTGSRAVWATVARRLVLGGNRVVLYDQRGHGQSTNADTLPSVPMLGHDLRAVLDATEARDVVLVGHSMGGMSVQSYATEHPDHFVDRVHGVVLVATAARVLGRTVPGRLLHSALGDGRREWTRRGRVGRAMVRGSLGRWARRSHVDLTLQTFADTTGVARAGYLIAMASMDLRAGLERIAVPATVVVGTRDLLTPPRLARQLGEALPQAEVWVLPGAGHMLPLEEPDRIVDAIRSTAKRISDARIVAPTEAGTAQ